MVTKAISIKNSELWNKFIIACHAKNTKASHIIENFVESYMGKSSAISFDEKRYEELTENKKILQNKIDDINLKISSYDQELFMLESCIEKRREEEREADELILKVQTQENFTKQIINSKLNDKEIMSFFNIRQGQFNSDKKIELQRRHYNNMFETDLTAEQFNIKISKAKQIFKRL